MLTVALVVSACSVGGTERRSAAAPTTETAAVSAVTDELPTTSEVAARDRQESDGLTHSDGDAEGGTAAAPDGDLKVRPVDEEAIVRQEAAGEAERDEHVAGQGEPTPAELEALRTAFNPSMPGGGVLAGYNNYWCALTSEGHIHCWGTTDRGRRVSELASTPWPSGTFVAIDVGSDFACAVRSDRALVCWGKDHYSGRELSTPDGEFASVTVGIRDACAIRTSATAVCWNVLDVGAVLPDNAQAPGGKFVSIAANGKRTCGVRAEGELACWGPIDRDQAHPADGEFISVTGPCAIRTDRSLACWDLSQERDSSRSIQPAIPSEEFRSASAAAEYGCAIALDGALECWGYEQQRRDPEVWFDQYIAVAATSHSACALSIYGKIRCLDINSPAGTRFGPGRETAHLPGYDAITAAPRTEELSARARRIGIGDDFMCMLQGDSTIRCFGSFEQWYHETNEFIDAMAPPGQFVSVVAGPNHACALTLERTVVCWGPSSQERDPRWGDPLGPGAVPSGTFTVLSTGEGHTCGLRDDRSVECWTNGEGRLLDTPDGIYTDVAAAGTEYSCALREDGVIVCWSAFGDHETRQHWAPSGHYVRLVSGGNSYWGNHYCGVRDDHLFTCWWDRDARRLSGEVHYESAFATFVDIAVGDDHACGLRLDGTVACWYHDGHEHMGAPEGEFSEIYAGAGTSCAVDSQGDVTCWGRTYASQASTAAQ